MHLLLEKQHQQLIDLLNDLEKCVLEGNPVHKVAEHLDAFIVSAEDEFKNEESIMEDYHYPDIIEHKHEHKHLLEQLYSVHNQLTKGHTPFGKDYMQWLRSWLEVHLLDADSKLDAFLYQNGDRRNKTLRQNAC